MANQSSENSELLQSALFSPNFAANPYPLLAQIRSTGAVVQMPMPPADGTGWLVTRLEEAVQVLKDSKHFTVDAFGDGDDSGIANGANFFSTRTMISVDEPDHTRLRGLVSKAFTPRFIEDLRPHIQQIADELLDKVQATGKMDVVHDYGYPLPINVISDMLGIPQENRDPIRQWSQVFSGFSDSNTSRDTSARAFSNVVIQSVEAKRKHPENDLISHLVQMEAVGDHLSQNELLSMIGLLIFAGHETTSNLIGIGTLTLLDHADQLAKLTANLSLVPAAVEEFLRFNGPVTMPAPRFVTEDIEFGGHKLHRGDMVMVMLSSANHDEQQFTDPEALDIARKLNRHIAFGQGIHYCLGAPLARLEGEIAFTTLLKRMPNIRLSVPRKSIRWRNGFNLRGLNSLPVAFWKFKLLWPIAR